MKRGSPRLIEKGLEIHLVHEHARADHGCHLARLPHGAFVGKDAAWIMQIAENHETGLPCEFAFEFSQPQPESLLRAAFEAADLCSNLIENRQQRVVSRPLHQHLVAPVDERGQRYIVRHRGADGGDDALLRYTRFRRQALQILDAHRQLREWIIQHATSRQVEARIRAQLSPCEIV